MGDPGQKGMEYIQEAEKKLKGSSGFMSLFGYVYFVICKYKSF